MCINVEIFCGLVKGKNKKGKNKKQNLKNPLTKFFYFSIFFINIPTPLPKKNILTKNILRTAQSGWGFYFGVFMPDVYQKPFLSYKEQVETLKNRGLFFEDEDKALKILERISYHRLGTYWHIFLRDEQTKTFRENVSFDDVLEIYKFDMKLRRIVLGEIEKIEVAFRSKMAHVLSSSRGHFWLEQKNLLSKPNKHEFFISNIKKEIERSHDISIKSFKKNYSNETPPAFMVLEVTTFGTLSKLYKDLTKGLDKDKREIAQFFGLPDVIFASWIHTLSYVRNICAHFARLWNMKMRIRPKLPTSKWLDNKMESDSVYIVLSMIIYLLNIINPKHTFKQKLDALFSKYPSINKEAMGFPVNWQDEPLWK